MVTDYFLILGVGEDVSDLSVEEAYRYLSTNLNPTNFQPRSISETQADKCMSQIIPAYKALRDAAARNALKDHLQKERSKETKPEDYKPYIGHLCVAAGIITLDDLNEAIDRQSDIDLPMGQILQEKALLSQTELEGMLMGQRLYGSAPMRPLEDIIKRLMELTVVSKDMIKIALIDQRTSMKSVQELLVQRGWLSEHVLRILEAQNQTAGLR